MGRGGHSCSGMFLIGTHLRRNQSRWQEEGQSDAPGQVKSACETTAKHFHLGWVLRWVNVLMLCKYLYLLGTWGTPTPPNKKPAQAGFLFGGKGSDPPAWRALGFEAARMQARPRERPTLSARTSPANSLSWGLRRSESRLYGSTPLTGGSAIAA